MKHKAETGTMMLTLLLVTPIFSLQAAAPDLSKVATQADIDAAIAATKDETLKKSMANHADAILAAAKRQPHVKAVVRTIESAPGA